MIRANYAQQNRNCVREWGIGFTNPLSQFKDVLFNNFYVPDDAQPTRDQSAFNHGYRSEYSWHKALKEGALASTLQIEGVGTISALALAVKLAQADLTGEGSLDAIGSLIVQALADLVGSGEISDANLQAFLQAIADLTGSGDLDGTRTGLGALISALLGSGTAEDSILTGTGELDADLVVTGSGLTTENIGQAVWAAVAASNNIAGSMGEKLNDAGAAGNPWAALIAANNDPDTFGELIQQIAAASPENPWAALLTANNDPATFGKLVQDLQILVDELHKLQGLDIANPMTVTPTSRVAGTIVQEISGDGMTTSTVTRTT